MLCCYTFFRNNITRRNGRFHLIFPLGGCAKRLVSVFFADDWYIAMAMLFFEGALLIPSTLYFTCKITVSCRIFPTVDIINACAINIRGSWYLVGGGGAGGATAPLFVIPSPRPPFVSCGYYSYNGQSIVHSSTTRSSNCCVGRVVRSITLRTMYECHSTKQWLLIWRGCRPIAD